MYACEIKVAKNAAPSPGRSSTRLSDAWSTMSDGRGANCGCAASTASQSTTQTIGELEWERGIWNAALNGETGRVRAMLERDRRLRDARDGSGYTALHYAARAGNADVVALLLGAGADPNATTCSGGASPLHRAAYMGREVCVEMLLRKELYLNGLSRGLCTLPSVIYSRTWRGSPARRL